MKFHVWRWAASIWSLSFALQLSCAHEMLETPPVPVTWERFHREIRCQGDHFDGPDFVTGAPEECLQRSYKALADAAEGAVCRTHADCVVEYGWPEYGPFCLAVGRQWARNGYHRIRHDFCGFNDICAFGCHMDCEAVCVRARCKIKGQQSLLGLNPTQLRCARGELPPPEAPPPEPGPVSTPP